MLKSKFIEIAKTFSRTELREFRNFVRSPFHNTNKNVIRLVEEVYKYYPDLGNEKLDKKILFSKLYPSKKYNDVVMRILISDLLKLSEDYLSYINFRKDSTAEKKFLLNELSERKLHSQFSHHHKSAEKELHKAGLIDVSYFLSLFELQSIKINNIISRDKQHESAEDVLKQGEFLITGFLINLLNVAHELEMQREVLNVKFDFNIVTEFFNEFNIERLLKRSGEKEFRYQKVIEIYYYMYLSILHPGEKDNFFLLKDLVSSNLDLFTRKEKFNLFIILESLCTSAISSGKRDYYRYLLDVYKIMLSEKLYTHSESEYFQINLFRNIFYTALVLKEIEWAESFAGNYLDKVSPQQREDLDHLTRSLIHFENKEFEKALAGIGEVRYNYFVFKFDVRLLTLKIYFELNSFEPALSLVDTFSHFLNNNKTVSQSSKESFSNFLKFYKKFIDIKISSGKKDSGNLKEEILRTERLINKNWLLEKAGEL